MTLATTLLMLVTGVGIFILVQAVVSGPGVVGEQTEVLGRLERYVTNRHEAAGEGGDIRRGAIASLVAWARSVLVARDERALEEGDLARERLSDDLARADIRLRPSEWIALLVIIGVVLGVVLTLRFGPIVGVIVATVTPYFGGRFYLQMRHRRRVLQFDRQLGDVILLLSSSLKAGYSFPQAMAAVAVSAKPPTAGEFARTSRELQLGLPADEALTRMVERNGSEDLDLMMTAVQIQRVVGGNLAEILETIAETIRERIRIKGEIRTLTAQARVSGWIISLLPIGLAGILTVIAPEYFTPMFKETLGLIMLGVGLFSMSIGILIIKRIVKIKV